MIFRKKKPNQGAFDALEHLEQIIAKVNNGERVFLRSPNGKILYRLESWGAARRVRLSWRLNHGPPIWFPVNGDGWTIHYWGGDRLDAMVRSIAAAVFSDRPLWRLRCGEEISDQ